MIKVIKEGKQNFRATCSKCGCVFEYELEDLFPLEYVLCPCCKDHVYHSMQYEKNEHQYIHGIHDGYQNIPYIIPCISDDGISISQEEIPMTTKNVVTDDTAYWVLEADGFHCGKCHYKAESTQMPYFCPNCSALMRMRNYKSGTLLDNDNFPIE